MIEDNCLVPRQHLTSKRLLTVNLLSSCFNDLDHGRGIADCSRHR